MVRWSLLLLSLASMTAGGVGSRQIYMPKTLTADEARRADVPARAYVTVEAPAAGTGAWYMVSEEANAPLGRFPPRLGHPLEKVPRDQWASLRGLRVFLESELPPQSVLTLEAPLAPRQGDQKGRPEKARLVHPPRFSLPNQDRERRAVVGRMVRLAEEGAWVLDPSYHHDFFGPDQPKRRPFRGVLVRFEELRTGQHSTFPYEIEIDGKSFDASGLAPLPPREAALAEALGKPTMKLVIASHPAPRAGDWVLVAQHYHGEWPLYFALRGGEGRVWVEMPQHLEEKLPWQDRGHFTGLLYPASTHPFAPPDGAVPAEEVVLLEVDPKAMDEHLWGVWLASGSFVALLAGLGLLPVPAALFWWRHRRQTRTPEPPAPARGPVDVLLEPDAPEGRSPSPGPDG